MSMVLGGVALILTLAWGLTVILGSYDQSEEATANASEPQETVTGFNVVTDVETSWTARLILVATIPFFILELQNVFTSSTGRRIIVLIALIATVVMLIGYILFQVIIIIIKLQGITSQEMQGLLARSISTSQTAGNSWSLYFRATFFVIFGTFIACALAEPLISSVVDFADAANISSFWVSYMVLPLAINYDVLIQAIASATLKTKQSNSLTLSSLYGGVFMNNVIGLMPFLAPVYFHNLSSDASAELLVVLVICIIMGIFTSFNTTFPRWTGYLVLLLYPISLVTVYVLTSVFGWS